MKGGNPSCNTCRQRRVKCDGVRPVCGRCLKSNRQCLGFEEPNRLILKDETDTVIKRFRKRARNSSSEDVSSTTQPNSSESTSPSTVALEHTSPIDRDNSNQTNETQYPDKDDSTEWRAAVKSNQISPLYERNQVALFCCLETVKFKTLSWVMSDNKWAELLPEMMDRSEALTSVIHANAANYLAKAGGIRTTPKQALTHYSHALRQLQSDLYDPVRQKSDETLFATILLGIFDLHNNTNLGSWEAHVQGAVSIIQCNGTERYRADNSPSRVLAKYVRGFDIIRAMTNQEATIFASPEWEHLNEGGYVRPLDSLLRYYGKMTNIIAESEKVAAPTLADMANVFTQLSEVKTGLEEWRKSLPSYYEALTVPLRLPHIPEEMKRFEKYPYDTKLDYVTGFCGHTMNLYRAAVLRLDRHLLGRMFPNAKPSEGEISMAKEIVMSMPELSRVGGVFLLYPAVRAAKILSGKETEYIISVLEEMADDVPVAGPLAKHIMECELDPPAQPECKSPLMQIYGDSWDIQDSFMEG